MKFKKLEYLLIGLVTFSIVAKIFIYGLKGMNVIVIISFLAYAIYGIINNILITRKSKENKQKATIIALGLGYAGCLLGIMLIFMSWNNSYPTLISSGIFTLLLALVFNKINQEENGNFQVYKGIILSVLALIIFFLPNYTIYNLKHRDDPRLVELYINTQELKTDSAGIFFNKYIIEQRKAKKD